jgi:3-hydroxyisobutyrate dehydrogenase-like beta-hydroxyacid dehydrogenase
MSTKRAKPTVGFVGFGEVAGCFAAAFRDAGIKQRVYCAGQRNRPPYGAEFIERVREHGAEPVDTLAELVSGSDAVFSAVGMNAAQVGEEICVLLGSGQLLIDINSYSPGAKRSVGRAAEAAGAEFVDANLMGAVTIYGHGVQILSSGSGLERFEEWFSPVGLNIESAGDEAGTAATVKMFRTVVTKGMEALIVEAMMAARRAGVEKQAFDGICAPMDATPYSDFARMCILTNPRHSGRRAAETRDAARGLRELGTEPVMTEATARRLEMSADLGLRSRFVQSPPTDIWEVLDAYDAASGRGH